MNHNIDGPVMKRVVNVNNMKFKTRNYQNYDSSEPETNYVDLNKLKSNQNITLAKTIASRKYDINTFMKQTASELDIDDNLGILKLNPLYQNEESLSSYAELQADPKTETDKTVLSRNESQLKKTNLELMFERAPLYQNKELERLGLEGKPLVNGYVTKLDIKLDEINLDITDSEPASGSSRNDSQVSKISNKDYQSLIVQENEKPEQLENPEEPDQLEEPEKTEEPEQYITINDNSYEVYQTVSNDGTILPDSIHSFKDLDLNSGSSHITDTNENEDENEYNISHFDSISLSSQTIQARKSAEISAKTIKIKKEMNDQFISMEIKPTDILFNIIFTTLYQKFWISGIKNSSAALSSKVHFGDEVLSINDYIVNDKDSLVGLAKCSVGPTINLKLKRLPYGRVILINNISECDIQESILGLNQAEVLFQVFGIKLKQNTCKIEQILESGLFYKNGLKYDSNKVEFDLGINTRNTLRKPSEKDRLTKWVITEINGEYTNYKCSQEEILLRLRSNNVLSVVVQPYDLVKALFKDRTKYMLRSLSMSN